MNFPIQSQLHLQLLSRNEGKIKSYESCDDIRAWSHDVGERNRYLREWIKCDMPFCIIPVSTLAGFLRTMTCRSRGRATPRCHPDCKSKVILDSIVNSSHAMKECLKNDGCFEKYFEEEEFETSHWPCERCLEALKSIKMFWKIIAEKCFNVNISKNVGYEEKVCCHNDSVRDVAKLWQKNMVHQAVLVKANNRSLNCAISLSHIKCSCKSKCNTKDTYCRTNAYSEGGGGSIVIRKISKSTMNSVKSKKNRAIIGDCPNCGITKKDDRIPHKKLCKCTSVRVKTMDIGCNTCEIDREDEELRAYKINLEFVQRNYNDQRCEIDRLTSENTSLKGELQKWKNNSKWNTKLYCPGDTCHDDGSITLIPKPFECGIEDNIPVNTDSEMIITMKNCKNESFRHVSFLQVLHKTNVPIINEINLEKSCYKKEDPINLLTKVQKTLGAIVRREKSIATARRQERKSDIQATFQSVNPCRSAPSCSTVSSRCWTAADLKSRLLYDGTVILGNQSLTDCHHDMAWRLMFNNGNRKADDNDGIIKV